MCCALVTGCAAEGLDGLVYSRYSGIDYNKGSEPYTDADLCIVYYESLFTVDHRVARHILEERGVKDCGGGRKVYSTKELCDISKNPQGEGRFVRSFLTDWFLKNKCGA